MTYAPKTFTIPLSVRPLTLNSRVHWALRVRINRRIRTETKVIATSERNRLGVAPAAQPVSMALTLVTPRLRRPMDASAICESCKAVIDGLVDAGWMVDDSPAWATFTYAQRPGPVRAVEVQVLSP